MSSTIHLSNGIIITNPVTGTYCHSLTITDGFVSGHNTPMPKGSKQIDLMGCCAVPGFIDSHLHLVLASTGMGDVDFRACSSKEGFLSLLQEASLTIEDNQWLIGSGWSENLLGEMPDKDWFADQFSMPVVCYRSDFHSAVVNEALLQLVDKRRLQTLPGGERIEEGIIGENALFDGLLPMVPESHETVKFQRAKSALKRMHSMGITYVGTMEKLTDIRKVLLQLQTEKLMRLGVMCLDDPTPLNIHACNQIEQNDFLEITGFKTFLDGSLGSRTAKMYSDWCDAQGNGVWAGHAASGVLTNWIERVSEAGFAPVLHAIGDAAVGLALHELEGVDSNLVPRVEHAQCIAQQDLGLLHGRMFAVQPLHQPDDMKIAIQSLGENRIDELHNWRRMLEAGGILSFGSDWPIATPDPISAMAIAIGCGLTPSEALIASTTHAALSLRSEKAGNLGIGSYGDVVVLDQDPLKCDWKVDQPSVTMTILDGRIVYRRS